MLVFAVFAGFYHVGLVSLQVIGSDQRLGRLHFWLTFVGLLILRPVPMHFVGMAGMPKGGSRDYPDIYYGWNSISSFG